MIAFRENRWQLVPTNPAARLQDRRPAFVPEWSPEEFGPGRALLEITERFAQLLAERLERAPEKAKLAFLDLLGVEPLPPQPARCPVVFELIPGSGHARAPKRTPLLARSADANTDTDVTNTDITFETETDIGLAASRLVEVKAVLPGNRFVDHTQDVLGEQPFPLFAAPQPIPQELYLAHERLFAVLPGSVVELHVELAWASATDPVAALQLQWEYFDGGGWTPFAPFPPEPADATRAPQGSGYSEDGTLNLTRSGTLRLRVSGRPAAPTTIRGIKSHWIRARVLPAEPGSRVVGAARGSVPPHIDRIHVRGMNTVGGFRMVKKTEALRARPDSQVRIRLVDDNGAPLDPALYTLESLGQAPVTLSPTEEQGEVFFALPPTRTSVAHVRLRWGGEAAQRKSAIFSLPLPPPDRDGAFELARQGRLPTVAVGNGVSLDPTTAFYPLGLQPPLGATFLFACPEVFTKPGAQVTIFMESSLAAALPQDKTLDQALEVRWEYWNGSAWAPLPDLEVFPAADTKAVLAFHHSGEIRFTVPANMAVKNEVGQDQLWVRAHLAGGSYLVPQGGKATAQKQDVVFDKVFPPVVRKFRLEYEYLSPLEPAAACQTWNDFQWTDCTTAAAFGGTPFTAFRAAAEARPTLYLGFTHALPSDLVSLFIHVTTTRREPDLAWEYYDGLSWRRLSLRTDETEGLSQPGLVQFVWPGTPLLPAPEPVVKAEGQVLTFLDSRVAARFRPTDTVAVFEKDVAETGMVAAVAQGSLTLTAPLENKFAASATAGKSPLPRFGAPRHWVRILWPRVDVPLPGDPDAVKVSGIYLNAVWAVQAKSITNELVGGTRGTGGETFDLANRAILAGETVEVLELDGLLAEAGWPRLRQELLSAGQPEADLRLEHDEKTKKVIRAWVRWQRRANFAGSGPHDRHYVLERTRGRLQFGDGQTGRVPPVKPNNVRVSYQTGGGKDGNVPARAVNVVLGSVTSVQAVFNPLAASGGADGELKSTQASAEAILERGPQLVRHRYRAATAEDYEQLARAASPGVFAAQVVTPARTGCAVPAGSVHVVIVPHAEANQPEPVPSPQLLANVRNYLQARAPVAVARRVSVGAPTYFRVGVEVALVPTTPSAAGPLSLAAQAALAKFLHPVLGGPAGRGWRFGEAVYRSDLVKWLHARLKPHLAYVKDLRLLDAGVAVPEQVVVPPGQVPCAGPLRVLVLPEEEVCR